MTRIADLELLIRTADLGSLTAAAKLLDFSPAAASAAIKRLEKEWGAALFVRSTRSLRLSSEGTRVLPHVRQALQAMAAAHSAALHEGDALQGEVQLAVPSDLGRNVLLPWLEAFQQKHPRLVMRLHLADQNADLMRTSIDIAIRYGVPPSSTQVALPLAQNNRRVLVAAPAYLAQRGIPGTPQDLSQHEVLRFMLKGEVPKTWRFCIEGQWVDVPVQGKRVANDGEVVKRWVLAGYGLAYKSWMDVASELQQERLITVKPAWLGEPYPLYMVFADKRRITTTARALRDWLIQKISRTYGQS